MSDRKSELVYDDDLSSEDAAPVAGVYQSRRKWNSGKIGCIIIPDMHPARLSWPKRKDKKAFFERLGRAA